MWTLTIRDCDGEVIGVMVLEPKRFSTGSRGWYGTRKLEIDGERCQCQAQIVVIDSKSEAEPSAKCADGKALSLGG